MKLSQFPYAWECFWLARPGTSSETAFVASRRQQVFSQFHAASWLTSESEAASLKAMLKHIPKIKMQPLPFSNFYGKNIPAWKAVYAIREYMQQLHK